MPFPQKEAWIMLGFTVGPSSLYLSSALLVRKSEGIGSHFFGGR